MPRRCSASSTPEPGSSTHTAARLWTVGPWSTSIVRVGRLAEQLPEIVELDLNPLVVGPDGCVVVDARVRIAPASAADPALRMLGY